MMAPAHFGFGGDDGACPDMHSAHFVCVLVMLTEQTLESYHYSCHMGFVISCHLGGVCFFAMGLPQRGLWSGFR